MKFYGYGIVWDGDNNKPLVEFENGEFETRSKKTIKALTDLGYKNDGPDSVEPPQDPPVDPPVDPPADPVV